MSAKMLFFGAFMTMLVSVHAAPFFLELPEDHPLNKKLEVEEGQGWRHAGLADPWVRFFTQSSMHKIDDTQNDGFQHLHLQLIDAVVKPFDDGNGLNYRLKFVVGKTNCLRSDSICDYLNVVSRQVYQADVRYDYETREHQIDVMAEGEEIF